jgi:hypothetical protein
MFYVLELSISVCLASPFCRVVLGWLAVKWDDIAGTYWSKNVLQCSVLTYLCILFVLVYSRDVSVVHVQSVIPALLPAPLCELPR